MRYYALAVRIRTHAAQNPTKLTAITPIAVDSIERVSAGTPWLIHSHR